MGWLRDRFPGEAQTIDLIRGRTEEGAEAVAKQKRAQPPPGNADEARVAELVRKHVIISDAAEAIKNRIGLSLGRESADRELDAFLASLPADRRARAADYGMKIAAATDWYHEHPSSAAVRHGRTLQPLTSTETNNVTNKMRVLAKHGGDPNIAVLAATEHYMANRKERMGFTPEEARSNSKGSIHTGIFDTSTEPLVRSIALFSKQISKETAQEVVDRIGDDGLNRITMQHLWLAGAKSKTGSDLVRAMLLEQGPGFPVLQKMLERGVRPGQENLFYELAKDNPTGIKAGQPRRSSEEFRSLREMGFDINGPADKQGHNALARLIQEATPRQAYENRGVLQMLSDAGASWDQRGRDGLSARDIYKQKMDEYTAALDREHAERRAEIRKVPGGTAEREVTQTPAARPSPAGPAR